MIRYRRTILSAGILAVSLFYFIYALFCIESHHVRGVPDSGFFPQIIGVLLVVLSAVLTVKDFRLDRHGAASESGSKAPKKEGWNVLGTAVLLLVYIFLIEPLGFLIASTLYLFVQFLYLTDTAKLRSWKTYILYLLIAALVSAGIYYLFLYAFNLILPAGLLR